eukprot:TRINITY_DN7823_c0_g1_i1.p1 TRINITY_DN7823_c0_g1~~TRINITY_DN7823_c0_g1_i1.p1  ORF type:complete len:437 (+),score=48.92 TRINITY_DN7823_c0_g1_i1:2-1312(+)
MSARSSKRSSRPARKRCKYNLQAERCPFGSKCRFKRDRPANSRRLQHESTQLDEKPFIPSGYVLDPNTGKLFKEDAMLAPHLRLEQPDPKQPSCPRLRPLPNLSFLPTLTAVRRGRRQQHSRRLQKYHFLCKRPICEYASAVKAFIAMPNGDLGLFDTDHIFRYTTANDNDQYHAAVQWLAGYRSWPLAGLDDGLVFCDASCVTIVNFQGPSRRLAHANRGKKVGWDLLTVRDRSHVVAVQDKRIAHYDFQAERVAKPIKFASDVLSGEFLAATTLLVGLRNGHVYRCDTCNTAKPPQQLPFHRGKAVNCLRAVPGRSGLYIAHSMQANGLAMYDMHACLLSNQPMRTYPNFTNAQHAQARIDVSSCGELLAAIDDRNTLRLYDVVSGCPLTSFSVERHSLMCFRQVPDLQLLHTVNDNKKLVLLEHKRVRGPRDE